MHLGVAWRLLHDSEDNASRCLEGNFGKRAVETVGNLQDFWAADAVAH